MNRRVTDIDVESLAALSICGSHVQTEAAPKATSCEGRLFFPPETARQDERSGASRVREASLHRVCDGTCGLNVVPSLDVDRSRHGVSRVPFGRERAVMRWYTPEGKR